MTDLPLKARGCRWITVPGVVDPRGRLNFLQLGKDLDFEPKRMFWLHHLAPDQWRGRHAHRQSHLLMFAGHGSCHVHLDDGMVKETVMLDHPAKALYIGPWVWNELTHFASGSVIIVLGSVAYDEADFVRDYDMFRREVAEQRP